MIFVALATVAALMLLALLAELAAPGPSRVVTALHRYGMWPYLLPLLVAAGAVIYYRRPVWRTDLASLAVLGIVGWIAGSVRYDWTRRAMLRARWPSVARSCGLAVRKDRRGRQWPFDSTTTIADPTVGYLPVIRRPRLVRGVGIAYKLTPARGGTVGEV